MNAIIGQITRVYETGQQILELSAKYDFPPMNLLRGIFLHKGYRPDIVYKLFTEINPKRPSSITTRDYDELLVAAANDANSIIKDRDTTAFAELAEAEFVKFLKGRGIKMYTQNQLASRQIKNHGRAIITPDVLFIDKVYINGELISWIDYKSYALVPQSFLYKSIKAQAARYTAEYGPGAMVFGLSFPAGSVVPMATLLDATVLPSK